MSAFQREIVTCELHIYVMVAGFPIRISVDSLKAISTECNLNLGGIIPERVLMPESRCNWNNICSLTSPLVDKERMS